jgi:hypothetical protein
MGLGFGIRDPRSEIQDQGSGIWKNPISDLGSRGQKGTRSRIPDSGSRIQIRNTGREGKKLTHLVRWFVSLLLDMS